MVYFNIQKLDDSQIISLSNKEVITKEDAINELFRRYGKDKALLMGFGVEIYG